MDPFGDTGVPPIKVKTPYKHIPPMRGAPDSLPYGSIGFKDHED